MTYDLDTGVRGAAPAAPAGDPGRPPPLRTSAKATWVLRTGVRLTLLTAAPIVVILVIWQVVVWISGYPPAIFPGPIDTFVSIGEMASDGILLSDIGTSFLRLVIGLVVGIPLGTLIGLAMGVSRWSERAFGPPMNFGLATPGIAFIPLAILWFGLTDLTVISVIVLEVVLTVMLSTWTAVRGVEPALLNAARTMGVNGPPLFLRVLLPASLLGIIGGYRMAFSRAWRILVAAEMLAGVEGGLGFRIDEARTSFQSARVYAGIIVIGVVGVLLERFVLRSLEVMTVDRWGGST